MTIYSSQFYQGIVPPKLFDITYLKEHDDFMESKLEIIYRFLYKNIKLEVSFFKETSSIHYIQMENLGDGDTFDDIVLIDDAKIFDKKQQWITNNLGDKSKKIKLYFDDNSSLYSMTMNN
jgi:hypothetical protein